MKQELSSIDLHFLMKELKNVEGALLGKIFNNNSKQVFIQVYKKELGKKFLTYHHPFFWIGTKKSTGQLSNFASYLRKHYERATILSINQAGSERIIELILKKEKTAKIYFELFGQGNIIICDENNKIIYPLEVQQWKDRLIKKDEMYDWFKNEQNVFSFTEKEFRALEIKENISKTLAIQFNLGGVFAEELCLRANIDPKSKEVNQKQKKSLYGEFVKLLKEPLNPQVVCSLQSAVCSNNSELPTANSPKVSYECQRVCSKPIDITPVKLKKYSSFENKHVSSFSEALQDIFLIEEKVEEKINTKIKQLQKRIELQDQTLQNYEKKIKENEEKAEYVYNNYEKIEKLLVQGRQALKSNEKPVNFKINRKEKKIILEIM